MALICHIFPQPFESFLNEKHLNQNYTGCFTEGVTGAK